MPNAALASRLQRIWYHQPTPPWPLRMLSYLFGWLVQLRRSGYARGWLRSQRLAKPVVVVGNLTVGGSGKTPLVIWLSQQLRRRGLRAGIILRGYGGSAASANQLHWVDADSDPAVVGDEALLLHQRTGGPVVVCRDRVRAARHLMNAPVELIIADDGLQHLRLGRDFEIAVIDGERGLGNGHLLPAGPLREPAQRLAEVDAVVFNGEASGGVAASSAIAAQRASAFQMNLAGEWLLPLGHASEPVALASLAGTEVHALAGIGNPQRFFARLVAAGLKVTAHPFPDHHRYRAAELEFNDPWPVLMTEKDAVKCRRFAAANRWYLPVAASFADDQGTLLLARLQRCLDKSVG